MGSKRNLKRERERERERGGGGEGGREGESLVNFAAHLFIEIEQLHLTKKGDYIFSLSGEDFFGLS